MRGNSEGTSQLTCTWAHERLPCKVGGRVPIICRGKRLISCNNCFWTWKYKHEEVIAPIRDEAGGRTMLSGQSALPSILNSSQTPIVFHKYVSHILAEWAGFQICTIYVFNTIGNRLIELNPTSHPHRVSESTCLPQEPGFLGTYRPWPTFPDHWQLYS